MCPLTAEDASIRQVPICAMRPIARTFVDLIVKRVIYYGQCNSESREVGPVGL